MKLTIRDLFWLALLVGSLTVWAMERQGSPRAIGVLWRWFSSTDRPAHLNDAELKRRALLEKLSKLSDEQLDEHFLLLPRGNAYERGNEYEPCLVEMARRGLVEKLQEHYDELMAQGPGMNGFQHPENLEILAALRRAQGELDPLVIHASLVGRQRIWSKFHVPQFVATIENVDPGKEAVKLKQGGDNRGGRAERWRFVFTDEQGRQVGDSKWGHGSGGLSQTGPLPYGARSRSNNTFDLRSYVSPPPSGRYGLQVYYHNHASIASERDVSGLVVAKSKPISVEVRSRSSRTAALPSIEIPPALPILGACLVVALASMTSRGPCSIAGEQSVASGLAETPRVGHFPGISKRDFIWGMLIVALALGMWLDDGQWNGRRMNWNRRTEAEADWSIRVMDDAESPSNARGSSR